MTTTLSTTTSAFSAAFSCNPLMQQALKDVRYAVESTQEE
ncbi:hypothetical protein SCG7086_BX_00110 [Chlamydiales bacterium SCGC AG-110-P3]|nr:hypothetical protein SCG7086_BX_00110 [Chlamydiales bacterium SCGC AG-110-P3]